ncbi:MAG: NUDIX hydrolase [Conexibacteraceae bacterium]|nr:NUDIX hydrolase [Conexibacteraceae bacterium]
MTPRAAATVMLLRGGNEQLEVLMVRRTPAARFMAGVWVFPGGAVDPSDGDGQAGLRGAAVRELREEAGVTLPPQTELVGFARWITPEALPIRFDTWFYLAAAPADASPRVDGSEIVDWRWLTPAQALVEAAAGGMKLAFPTLKQLEQLSAFPSAQELLTHARAQANAIRPVRPRVVGSGEHERIVLPGED